MYTWMKSVKNIRAAIKYPVTDKDDQDERGERVEGVLFGGGLIDTGNEETVARQFLYYLNRAGRRYRKDINGEYPNQGWIKTISFSEKEIAKDDPDGADKALKIVQKVQGNVAPDCLWMAVAQRDGKGGFWHVHIVQSAVHSSTLKALAGRETSRDIFMKQAEKFAEAEGITLDSGEHHPKRKGKDNSSKKRHEHAKETEGYSWMDDLQRRIAAAALITTRASDFEENLEANGVKVSRKVKTGWTYELAECKHEEFIGKKSRYDKFSVDMSNATLHRLFDSNYNKMKAKGLNPLTGERKTPDISGVEIGPENELQK